MKQTSDIPHHWFDMGNNEETLGSKPAILGSKYTSFTGKKKKKNKTVSVAQFEIYWLKAKASYK